VDIEADTFNIDPALIEDAISPRTRAIMPVHLYGYPCNMDAIQAIAQRRGLAIIEDAAQAVGADYKGRRVGSFGTGCFSLYATKNVMSGEGGMITTDDDTIAHTCRLIRNHGMQQRYSYEMVGYNFRLSDLHAAIGLAQLDRLEDFTMKRRANAAYLNAHIQSVVTPTVREGYGHVWHQYTVRVASNALAAGGMLRDRAVQKLSEAGIGTGIFYPVPAHKQTYLQHLGLGEVALPIAEKLAGEVISLPVHPQLSPTDLEQIVQAVNSL
jgi:dTDP-4-amino-4,6-dideoxygalactose transaminase